MDFLSISNTMLTVPGFGYAMSYLEFFGVIANLLCVWWVGRKNMLTWPVGIIGSALFITMFWQIHLYSDAILNLYFVITGFYGWYVWKKPKQDSTENYKFSDATTLFAYAGLTLCLTMLWGGWISTAHVKYPMIFTQPAAYPMWDSFILMASFVATWHMIHKRVECWIYWIVVDIVSIVLYWVKDVKFTSLLYVIFLGLAINGLINWNKTSRIK